MTAKTGSAHARYAGLLPIEPQDDLFCPIDLKPEPISLKQEDVRFRNRQPLARQRRRAPARFLIAFCTGIAITLLWQSYGDAAREMIGNLSPQLGWLAPRPAQTVANGHPSEVTAPAAPAEQLNAISIDFDEVGQNADKNATTIAADQEPATRSSDQIASAQEPTKRSTNQAVATKDSSIAAESRAEGASSQPPVRLATKSTEARQPQTLAEKGKPPASCFASASAALYNHPGGWPTWTLRAPGHEGTMCWYVAARPRRSDHRASAHDHRNEMTPQEKDRLGAAETEPFVPFAPRGGAGMWVRGLP
jgi:hypothetical protein